MHEWESHESELDGVGGQRFRMDTGRANIAGESNIMCGSAAGVTEAGSTRGSSAPIRLSASATSGAPKLQGGATLLLARSSCSESDWRRLATPLRVRTEALNSRYTDHVFSQHPPWPSKPSIVLARWRSCVPGLRIKGAVRSFRWVKAKVCARVCVCVGGGLLVHGPSHGLG